MLTNEPLLFGFTSRPILYSQNETDVQSLIAQLYIYLDNSNNGEINYATSWSSVKCEGSKFIYSKNVGPPRLH